MMYKHGQKFAAAGLTLCLALGGAAGLAEDMQAGALQGAMAQLEAAESMTLDAQFTLRQNGEDRITGEALCQIGGGAQYASALITLADGGTHDLEMSTDEGTRVVRIGDAFFSMPVAQDTQQTETTPVSQEEAAEAAAPEGTATYLNTVVEQLFGAAMEKMTISEDGLSLHLAGDEVPAIVNLAVSMLSMDTADTPDAAASAILHGTRGDASKEQADVSLAMSLGDNLRVDRVDLDVAIENGFISGIQCSIVLLGEDEAGASLETAFACVIRVTDVNATAPATVDTTGVEMTPYHRNLRRAPRAR